MSIVIESVTNGKVNIKIESKNILKRFTVSKSDKTPFAKIHSSTWSRGFQIRSNTKSLPFECKFDDIENKPIEKYDHEWMKYLQDYANKVRGAKVMEVSLRDHVDIEGKKAELFLVEEMWRLNIYNLAILVAISGYVIAQSVSAI